MSHEGFVDGNPGLAAEGGELAIKGTLGTFDVFFGTTDGAVLVDGPGDFRPDVAVGHGLHALSEHAGALQFIDPHFPVFPAHDGHGLGDLVVVGWLDGDFVHDTRAGVEVLVRVGAADGLEAGLEDLAGFRMRAAWAGEGIDDAIHLAEIRFDGGDDVRLHRIGVGVAIERACVEARGFGFGLKGGGIVPSGGAAAIFFRRLFKEHTDGGRIRAKSSRDA